MVIKLSHKQGEIARDPSRFKVVIAGRRSGKTVGAILKCIYEAVSKKNQLIAYVGLSYSNLEKTVLVPMLKFIPPSHIKKVNRGHPFSVKLKNGSEIFIATSKQDGLLRGPSYSGVVIDEIGEQKASLWTEVLRPGLSDQKGWGMLIGTPKGKKGLAYYALNNPEYEVFRFGSVDGGWVDPDEIESARRELTPDEFAQEYLGQFIADQHLCYYSYDEKLNSTDETFNLNRRTVLATDFNIRKMSTLILQEIDIDKWVVVKEFVDLHNTRQMVDETLKYLRIKGYNGRVEWTGDHSGNSVKTSSEASDWDIIRQGYLNWPAGVKYKVTSTNKNGGIKKGRVEPTNRAFINDRLRINKKECPATVKDLYSTGWNKDGKIDEQGGTVSHLTDALSYHTMNYGYKEHQDTWEVRL